MTASKPDKEFFSKTKYPAEDYAEKFDVHVKTILRAVLNTPNPSDWAPESLSVLRVATAFSMKPEILLAVMKGKEFLKDAEKAAELMGVSIRRFHQKRVSHPTVLKPVARHGRTVRYALTEIAAVNDL